MVRGLLIRGMLAGVIAGLLAFGAAKIYGEPQVDRAIAFEGQHAEADASAQAPADAQVSAQQHQHGDDEEELVSRKVQSTAGLLTAVAVYGAAMGGLFALAFAFLYGRVGDLSPRLLALLLAIAAFVAIYYVPSLKYPASPPAVGEPDTIAYRTGLFFLMILISLAALVFAVSASRRLAPRYGGLSATLIGAGLFAGVVVIAQLVLPDIDEVPADFPAIVLWKFRMASLAIQVLMWSTLGLTFGWLAARALGGRQAVVRPKRSSA
ncbi:MAG TPA: CbtA family protein [Methyloceanibacter sp.]|nr:CbtA family protein [Methyloceanibacter sp.]